MAQDTGSPAAMTERGSSEISPCSHSTVKLYGDPLYSLCPFLKGPLCPMMSLNFQMMSSSSSLDIYSKIWLYERTFSYASLFMEHLSWTLVEESSTWLWGSLNTFTMCI